jgi:hypothetical protein
MADQDRLLANDSERCPFQRGALSLSAMPCERLAATQERAGNDG